MASIIDRFVKGYSERNIAQLTPTFCDAFTTPELTTQQCWQLEHALSSVNGSLIQNEKEPLIKAGIKDEFIEAVTMPAQNARLTYILNHMGTRWFRFDLDIFARELLVAELTDHTDLAQNADAVEALIDLVEDNAEELKGYDGSLHSLQVAALTALGTIHTPGAEAVLRDQVQNNTIWNDLAEHAIATLGKNPTLSTESIALLWDIASAKDNKLSKNATQALGSSGTPAAETLLLNKFNDKGSPKALIIDGLAHVAKPSQATVVFLMNIVNDSTTDWDLKLQTVRALGKATPLSPAAFAFLKELATNHDHTMFQDMAINALSEAAQHTQDAQDFILNLLRTNTEQDTLAFAFESYCQHNSRDSELAVNTLTQNSSEASKAALRREAQFNHDITVRGLALKAVIQWASANCKSS